ncbi:MAG: hypothetical protein JWP80_2969 [Pseudomonas sp.]|nr:hypothetical protein [Pseudomonas sp.]
MTVGAAEGCDKVGTTLVNTTAASVPVDRSLRQLLQKIVTDLLQSSRRKRSTRRMLQQLVRLTQRSTPRSLRWWLRVGPGDVPRAEAGPADSRKDGGERQDNAEA